MAYTESNEMYLEVIYEIYLTHSKIRLTDIADKLNITKPSASRGINILKDDGYITKEHYGEILLTNAGILYGKELKDKHLLIKLFLETSLKIDKNIAEKDACRIEHIISNETINAIKDYLNTVKNSNK